VRAGRRSERAFLVRLGFTQKAAANISTAGVVTLPHSPLAGQEIEAGHPGCMCAAHD
jgi:hypothetical protein